MLAKDLDDMMSKSLHCDSPTCLTASGGQSQFRPKSVQHGFVREMLSTCNICIGRD